MTHSKVFGYVRTNLKKGYSRDDIRKALIKASYGEAEISKAFEDVDNHHHAAPKLLWIVIITIIILGIAFLIPWNNLFAQGTAEPDELQGLYITNLEDCAEEHDTESAEFLECAYRYETSIKTEQDCRDNIEEEMALQVCISVINRNMDTCMSEKYPNQIDFCNTLYAFILDDVTECDHVRIDELRDVCVDKFEKQDYSAAIYPYNFLWVN